MTRPSILLVTPWPGPADGIAMHSVQLATALAAHADVTVLCRNTARLRAVDGVTVLPELGGLHRTRAAVRAVRPDAVYVQFAVPAFGTATLAVLAACREARRGGGRTLIAFHEAVRERARLGPVAPVLYRRLLAECDVPVALTPAAGDVLRAADQRIDVVQIPHGVGALPAAADAAPGGDRPFVLCAGFIHPDKGIDDAIRTIARLRDRGRAVPELVVAGSVRRRHGVFRVFGRIDERCAAGLHALVDDLDLGDHVRFAGYLDDVALAAALRSAAVVLLPYRSTTQSGVAALTTAAGAPVVASDLPGLVDGLGLGAMYAAVGDIDGYADAIDRVLTDPSRRAALVAAQRRRRSAQSMAAVAQRIVDTALGRTADRAPTPAGVPS